VACLRLFEAVHPGGVTDNVGNHPNAFFNSSFEYSKAVEKKKKTETNAPAGTAAKVEESKAGGDTDMS
jgi:hypothetical protein